MSQAPKGSRVRNKADFQRDLKVLIAYFQLQKRVPRPGDNAFRKGFARPEDGIRRLSGAYCHAMIPNRLKMSDNLSAMDQRHGNQMCRELAYEGGAAI